MLYDMGEVTGNIDVRLLKTQYYGMLIAKYNEVRKQSGWHGLSPWYWYGHYSVSIMSDAENTHLNFNIVVL